MPNTQIPPFAGWWWLAFNRSEPVAFAGMRPSYQWGNAIYLSRCGVLREYRGLALQQRLIRVRQRHARSLGVDWLITDTRQNPVSSNNLIREGFLLFEPSEPWGHKDALYWRKKLTNRPIP